MPPVDPTAQAHYSFLPWLRRGIINLADTSSLSEKNPLTVPVRLQAIGEGEVPVVVEKKVQLYGPQHIGGIDRRAIVRTIPRAGVRTFEANFLCGIEFYEEDFPWRYSPLLPSGGKLAPWLWVVALRQEEFVRRSITEGRLPSIEISSRAMQTAFPDPATSWAWAHTHLNFNVEGTNPAEKRKMVEDMLDDNPNLGCSRLLCPRRLQPETPYTAFLIPAFERGRLAGLGKTEEIIEAVANAAPSWSMNATEAKDFPVYYEWEFVTQSAGDFESLASRLGPLTKEEAQALAGSSANRLMDIRKPGWGLQYTGASGTIAMESALRPINQTIISPITENTAQENEAFISSLASLLNLGAGTLTAGTAQGNTPNPFFQDSTVEDDPIIVPPLYGLFYRDNPLATNPKAPAQVNAATPAADWYNQLNLNPALRIAASQGAAVVQKDQELYMDRAWDQISQTYGVQQVTRRWHYSLEISQALFNKRFLPMLQNPPQDEGTESTFRKIALMAPMYQSLVVDNKSFFASIRQKSMPAAYSPAFTKLTRKGGPLVKRLSKRITGGIFFPIRVIPVKPPQHILFASIKNIVDFLDEISTRRELPGRPPVLPRVLKDRFLRQQGLGGLVACKQAFSGLLPFVQHITIMTAPAPVTNGKLQSTLAAQINPGVTIPARLRAVLPKTPITSSGSGGIAPLLTGPAPEFTEAMYRPLAERSPDFILPGIDQIPANRVVLLKTNPSFIESYLVGLNHELSREYLWREFPAPLNTTAFRQFWDVRDNQSAAIDPATGKDITAITTWNTTPLGTHQPAARVMEKMVVLIRGDLLRKYPNTEIFMQRMIPGANTTFLDPLFTAQLEPDIKLLGFNLSVEDATTNQPGWLFVLKERAGDVNFGLDMDDSTTDPSWKAIDNEVPVNSCLQATSTSFTALPGFRGGRADAIAAMLFQKPFMLYVPASRLVPKQ